MMDFNIIVSGGAILFGIGYLIKTNKFNHHMDIDKQGKDGTKKYDEELNILDSIIHQAKLKNQGKSIDEVLENIKIQEIAIDFKCVFGERNERH